MKIYVFALIAIAMMASCKQNKWSNEKSTVAIHNGGIVVNAPKAVNMRDSLVIEDGKGAIVERQYSGLLPGADVPGIEYDLKLYYQQDSENGLYELTLSYIDENRTEDRSFPEYGQRWVLRGIPGDPNAIVYRLIPENDGRFWNFALTREGNLMLLDNNMRPIDSEYNYTLRHIN